MRILDARVAGYHPMQHKGYHNEGYSVDMRMRMGGVRITGRFTGTTHIGHFKTDPESWGDIHGGQLLTKIQRDIHMWRYATPVIVGGAAGAGADNAQHSGMPGIGLDLQFTPESGVGIGAQSGFNLGGAVTPIFGPATGQSQSALVKNAINADNEPASGLPQGGQAVNGPGQAPPGGAVPTPNPNASDGPNLPSVIPIFDSSIAEDGRFSSFVGSTPRGGGVESWPKVPKGILGISLIGNDERDQHDLFHWTDPRLVAANFAGDKKMGTPVVDLTKENEIDDERWAPLQSAFRVIKKPLGGDNVLGFQLGPSGLGDTWGGYFIDRPETSKSPVTTPGPPGGPEIGPPVSTELPRTVYGYRSSTAQVGSTAYGYAGRAPDLALLPGNGLTPDGQPEMKPENDKPNLETQQKAIGRGSRYEKGPFDCGPCQRHKSGEDDDGNPIGPLHIWHNFLLRRNDTEDGELNITVWEPPGDDGDEKVPVYFGFNHGAKKWDWYSTTNVYESPPPPPYSPPPSHPSPSPTPTPASAPVASPAPVPGTPDGPVIGEPTPTYHADPIYHGSPGEFGGDTPFNQTQTMLGTNLGLDLGYLMTDRPLGLGGLVAKPENYQSGNLDRRFGGSALGDAAASAARSKRTHEFPITGTMSAFGAQGGASDSASVPSAPAPPPASPPPTPSPGSPPPPAAPSPPGAPSAVSTSPSNVGATGDPWNYTHKPKAGRYRGGTAHGGWLVLPPEADPAMVDADFEPPSNKSKSETYFMMGPGASFAAGLPSLASGRPKKGVSWGDDDGDLVFKAHYAGETAGADMVRFDRAGQTISWYARTGNKGTLRHFNQDDRVYDFPDVTGSVLVWDSSAGADPLSTSTVLGMGSGPSVGHSIWARVYLNGDLYWVPLWR